jgi:prolyl 4-hydroxylase
LIRSPAIFGFIFYEYLIYTYNKERYQTNIYITFILFGFNFLKFLGWGDIYRMSHGHLDGNWQNWVQHNLNRGCDVLEMASILEQHGFRGNPVVSALGAVAANTIASKIDHGRLAQIDLVRLNQALEVGQTLLTTASTESIPDLALQVAEQVLLPKISAAATPGIVPQKVDTDKFQLYTIPHFLSDVECDQLLHLVNQRLRPSTLTIPTADQTYRNSKTSDLCLIDHPLVGIVDNRIAHTLGIQLPYSEGIQAQRYDVGEQFKQHTDFFEPGTPEYQHFASSRGNRTWTFMIYLNNVDQGGGTHFFSINQTFMPEKGLALAWNNLHPDGRVNPDTLHAGLPVEAGCKVIITKWFRELGNGPMFF